MILKAEEISKSYRGRKVVNNISIEVHQGEIVGLLGPNGAGKTTSFYMIVGIIKPEGGDVFLDQEVISSFPMYQRAQKGIGYLAQEESVFRKLSVEDNILGILEFTDLTKNQQKEKAEQLMEEFGLIKIRKSRGDLLSGGERRRTEIARALANDPKFLLLDEPFAGVDPIAVEDIQSIISSFNQKNAENVIKETSFYIASKLPQKSITKAEKTSTKTKKTAVSIDKKWLQVKNNLMIQQQQFL